MGRVVELPTVEELSWMEPAELEAALRAVEQVRRLTEAAYIDVLDVADRQRVWAADGHRSVKNWAVALTGVSPVEAARRCQALRALRDLDELRERLRAGEVGVCQVRELARLHANPRVRERLTRAEALMVGAARRRCFEDFQTRVGRWQAAADPPGAARSADEAHAGRRADFRFTPAGVTLTAHGGTTQGIELIEILEAFEHAEFDADWGAARAVHGDATDIDELARTGAQRRYDALCRIFEVAATAGGAGGGAVRVPTVDIVCDQATFEAHLAHAAGGPAPRPAEPDDTSRRCETRHGVAIDPRDAVVAALIGYVRRVVTDSAGVVIDAGRRRRLFTGALREVVWVQGTQCLWPGCGRRADQQDHTQGWATEHGVTDPAHAGPTCGHHNRWKTRGYATWRDADGVWHVRRPDGTELTRPRLA